MYNFQSINHFKNVWLNLKGVVLMLLQGFTWFTLHQKTYMHLSLKITPSNEKKVEREEQEKKDKSVEEKNIDIPLSFHILCLWWEKKTFDFCNTVFINPDISKTSVHVYWKLAILLALAVCRLDNIIH